MKFSVDEIFANGEWVTGILYDNQPVAMMVPGLNGRQKREVEEKFQEWVGVENEDVELFLDCVKDDINAIDAVDVQYEIGHVVDVLQEVRGIVKSKQAKELLLNAISRLEDDIYKMLDDVDTSTELALERINEFLEKN